MSVLSRSAAAVTPLFYPPSTNDCSSLRIRIYFDGVYSPTAQSDIKSLGAVIKLYNTHVLYSNRRLQLLYFLTRSPTPSHQYCTSKINLLKRRLMNLLRYIYIMLLHLYLNSKTLLLLKYINIIL